MVAPSCKQTATRSHCASASVPLPLCGFHHDAVGRVDYSSPRATHCRRDPPDQPDGSDTPGLLAFAY